MFHVKQPAARGACAATWTELGSRCDLLHWSAAEQILDRYVVLLLASAATRRLVARSQMSEAALWTHIFDCLQSIHLIDPARDRKILDAGSGNGLPGIVLAAALPSCALLLVDRSESKCGFLEYAGAQLGLGNVTVRSASLDRELLSSELPDLIVMRALVGPEKLRRLAAPAGIGRPLLIFATPASSGQWRAEALACRQQLAARHPYRLPGSNVERELLRFNPA